MNIKKKIMVLLAVGVMAFSVSPFVMAATPAPAGNVQQEQQEDTQIQQTAVPVAGTVQTTQTEMVNSKYLTKGGAAVWFVLTFVLNAALSFWIGNRFYRMSKKDNHISGEIRALRRDIEDKFVKNIGGFSEQELDIENLNESLAMSEDGIRPAEKKPVLRDINEEEEERFRRWEEAQSRPRTERASRHSSAKSIVREELEEDFDEVKRINRKNYQPKRSHDERFEEEPESEDIGETKEITLGGNVKTKAKEILGDIFPFKED